MNRYQELKQQLEEEKDAMLAKFLEVAKVGDYATIGTQLYVIASKWKNELYLAPLSVGLSQTTAYPMPVGLNREIIPEVTLLNSDYDIGFEISQHVIKNSNLDDDIPF
jgi:hypothetical protein